MNRIGWGAVLAALLVAPAWCKELTARDTLKGDQGVPVITTAHDLPELPELALREEIGRQATALLREGDRAAIDAQYRHYVADGTRTSSGLWVSGIFSGALNAAILDPRPSTPEAWDRLEREVRSWAADAPDSGAARLLAAEVIVRRAWSIRGGGYASTVPKEAWKPFHAHLRRAREYLRAEADVAARYPEYYVIALEIEKALGDDDAVARAVFDEGISKYPGYYPVYFAMLNYLLPKWHGGPREIEAFTKEAVESSRALEGEGMYARIYWYASQVHYTDTLFLSSYAHWDAMKSGFDDVIARYPDQWNLQNYAHFACMAGDAETTRTLIARVEQPLISEAWSGAASFAECERLAGILRL